MRAEGNSAMVIDDHPLICEGVKSTLLEEENIESVKIALNGESALKELGKEHIDLIVLDLSLPDYDGPLLVEKIREITPDIKILVYTMSEEQLFGERVAAAGVEGYLMKTTDSSELLCAVRAILEGYRYFNSQVQQEALPGFGQSAALRNSILDKLSGRQLDIFKLLGEGLNSATIAERLKISPNTVDTHRINIKNKLKLPNGKAVERLAYEVIRHRKIP